jgi:hypothetical protein
MSNGYRRGSVFGALILIGVGGLFLYANLNPEFRPWLVLAKFWPLLIILWGVGKLVDYLMLRGTPEGAAASRLTGGDIFGLILLLIFGTAVSQAVNRNWGIDGPIRIGGEELGCFLGKEFEFSQEVKQAVTAPGSLTLENRGGNVTISGGVPPGGELRLVARKKVCAASDAEAYRLSQAFEPVLAATGDGYELQWNVRAGERGAVAADLDVQVPPSITAVNLTVDHGDLRASNFGGDVNVEMRPGGVDISKIGGNVAVEGRGKEFRVREVKGSARIECRSCYGPIELAAIGGAAEFDSSRTNFRAEGLPGELKMESGEMTLRGARGEVTLATREYEIEVEDVPGPLRLENRNGRVTLRLAKAPTQPIEVSNSSGSIELILPAGSGFVLDASVRNGDIKSDFTGGTLALTEEHGDSTLAGAYGNGRVPIELSTSHGTIYLRRTRAAGGASSGK